MPDHQFYTNSLPLTRVDKHVLQESLRDLRTAIKNGVDLIEAGDPASKHFDGRGIFSGSLGIAVAFLRLAYQAPSLRGPSDPPLPAFHNLAQQRIPADGPDLPPKVGGLSPLPSNSPLAAVVVRVLEQTTHAGSANVSSDDFACLREAVDLALGHGPAILLHGRNMGGDEILFGRCGLLWALLSIRTHFSAFPHEQQELLLPILDGIPKLVYVIVSAGREGANAYREAHGEKDALPLMWMWMEGFYGIGIAHGMTGILPALLACRLEELSNGSDSYIPDIAATTTGLCRVCIEHNGHLPISIPTRPSSKTSYLVQICHGSPSILTLLGCARRCEPLMLNHWEPEWDQAARLATDCVWREGLLTKGGGLCHGIAGNAWPLLFLHDSFEYSQDIVEAAKTNYARRSSGTSKPTESGLTGDYFLSRALAMMLHARETKPYRQSLEPTPYNFRMPDHPWSLFEGLAGTVCAWAETCAVIQARLRKLELEEEGASAVESDAVFKEHLQQQLGFPCVGGNGPSQWL